MVIFPLRNSFSKPFDKLFSQWNVSFSFFQSNNSFQIWQKIETSSLLFLSIRSCDVKLRFRKKICQLEKSRGCVKTSFASFCKMVPKYFYWNRLKKRHCMEQIVPQGMDSVPIESQSQSLLTSTWPEICICSSLSPKIPIVEIKNDPNLDLDPTRFLSGCYPPRDILPMACSKPIRNLEF